MISSRVRRNSRRAEGSRLATGSSRISSSGSWPEGQDDAEGLELADRERADAVFQGQAPAGAEVVDQGLVPGGIERGGVGDDLPHAHPGVADHLLRDVAEAGFDLGRQVPGVLAQDGRAAGRGAEQAERAFNERAFAAAVLAEQAEDRAGLDLEIDARAGRPWAGRIFARL